MYAESVVLPADLSNYTLTGVNADRQRIQIERDGQNERITREVGAGLSLKSGIWHSHSWQQDTFGSLHYALIERNFELVAEHRVLTGDLFRLPPTGVLRHSDGGEVAYYSMPDSETVYCTFRADGLLSQVVLGIPGRGAILSDFGFASVDSSHRVIVRWRRNSITVFDGSLAKKADHFLRAPMQNHVAWPSEMKLPLREARGAPVIEVEINGKRAYVAVSSRTEGVTLSRRFATALGIHDSVQTIRRVTGGGLAPGPAAKIDCFKIGSVTLSGLRASITSEDVFDGRIGLDVLSGLVVTFDEYAKVLSLSTRTSRWKHATELDYWDYASTFSGFIGQAQNSSIAFDTSGKHIIGYSIGMMQPSSSRETDVVDGREIELSCDSGELPIYTRTFPFVLRGKYLLGAGHLCSQALHFGSPMPGGQIFGGLLVNSSDSSTSIPQTIVAPSAIGLRRYAIDTRADLLYW